MKTSVINFEGERAIKVQVLFTNIRKKSQNGIIDLFFLRKKCQRRRKFGQNRFFLVFCESSENQFDTKITKNAFSKTSKKIRPPLTKS